MARRVAFCLVENDRGEVLFIQRGYGKEKGKWSLPGGFVDRGESSRHAAYRETREETGIIVEIVATVMVGRNHPVKTFAGRVVGGKLRFQRRECLAVKFRDPAKIPPHELAFGGDRRALRLWAEMKAQHAELKRQPLPDQCPQCGESQIRLRHYPHQNPYRCDACQKTFQIQSPIVTDSKVATPGVAP